MLKNGIRRTMKSKSFDGPPLQVCQVSMSPKYRIPHVADQILSDRSHILYMPTRKRFEAILDGNYDECRERLWMEISANTMQKKKVVRSWAKRRVEQAVTEALRTRGFGTDGKRLVDRSPHTPRGSESKGSHNIQMRDHAPEALAGTVKVLVLPKSIETNFAEVQSQIGGMVDQILKKCGRNPRPVKYDPQQQRRMASYDMINMKEPS